MNRFGMLAAVSALLLSISVGVRAEDGNAKPTMDEKFQKFCARTNLPNGQRLADLLMSRLELREAQKPALAALRETFAAGIADGRKALCSTKPDFSTVMGRFLFDKSRLEVRFERMKLIEPKIQALYEVLDDKQKAAFNQIRITWEPPRKTHGDANRDRDDNANP